MLHKLAITMGDTNGIGPEILVKALSEGSLFEFCQPIIFGDRKIYETVHDQYSSNCPGPLSVSSYDDIRFENGFVPVVDCGLNTPKYNPGKLDPEAGRCAIEWVKEATRLAIEGKIEGIVTCPINKEGIHLAGYNYPGHTDLLAELTGTKTYRMCLFGKSMRIVHISAHESMVDAISMVKKDRIVESIRIGHEALQILGLPDHRIAVSGLNPHAGEAGAFGREEIEEIAPAVELCRCEGINCSGPYPPDTVFARMRQGDFDLVVAMYHDQGHGPFKLVAMDEGVNVTLGLPIIRTSVDHGTAYDIAGKGIARESSLCAAVKLAAQFAQGEGPR